MSTIVRRSAANSRTTAADGPIPTSVQQADRMGLHPLIALMCVSGLLFFAFVALEVAPGGGRRLDSAILIALRTPGNLAKPIGPGWMLQSAIDLSALGGFTSSGSSPRPRPASWLW